MAMISAVRTAGQLLRLEGFPKGQFRVSNISNILPISAVNVQSIEVSGFRLEYHKDLKATTLRNYENQTIGVLLGNAFDVETKNRVDQYYFASTGASGCPNVEFERLYERLFGSWIVLILIKDRLRMYLDAGGTLSAVYSSEKQIAGATAAAILSPEEYIEKFDDELYSALDVSREGWFPSTLTAHKGVRRVLVNHYLDFDSWKIVRHWPQKSPPRSQEAEVMLDKLSSIIRRNMSIILANHNPGMALTGGYDTRVLLSSCVSCSKMSISTFIIKDRESPDSYIARMLSGITKVPHYEYEPVYSSPDDATLWHLRSGHAIGGNNANIYTTVRKLNSVDALIEGFGGEFCRGFFWRRGDTPSQSINARNICARFGMRLNSVVVNETGAWLESLPKGDIFYTLDMAYLELRISAWLYAQSYVDAPLIHYSPMISRRSFEVMLRMPVDCKYGNRVPKELIRRASPALLEVPFNRYNDIRDMWVGIQKLCTIHLVKKKVRKLWAR